MESLYKITAEQQRLNDIIEAADGEITEEIEAALEINAANLETKAEDYAASILEARARLQAIQTEQQRLAKLARTEKRKEEMLSTRLSDALQLFGIAKMDAGKYRLSFRKSVAVEIEDEEKLPAPYLYATLAVDKAALKEALQGGQQIAGATLVTKQNLQIK